MNERLHIPRHSRRRLSFRLVVLTLVGLLAVFAVVVFLLYRSDLEPVNKKTTSAVSFEIQSGQGEEVIAANLKKAGLIREPGAFRIYVYVHGLRTTLQAGTYSLSPSQSTETIAAIISHGKIAGNLLIIPEGTTNAKITELVAAHGISSADFKVALNDSSYTGHYARMRPGGVDLEGYLFPDGYQIQKSTTAHQLIQDMLDNFDHRFSDDLTAAFAAEGLTPHEGLTLASIVEREAGTSADRPIVAQVFLKRLRDGQPLQSDVTVQYGADQLGVPFNIKLNSPYNTYANKGLPIGPICNPGIDSLNAVAHPASTNYSYFVADKNGKTHYATTFAEHQANIAKYLN